MMIYGYQCRECGQEYTSKYRGDVLMEECDCCGEVPIACVCGTEEPIKRKYSISATPMMHSHHNPSTGTMISSSAQFKRELAVKSEQEEERTGIPCKYEPVDPDEIRAHVVASDAVGLEETNRQRVNEGRPAIGI